MAVKTLAFRTVFLPAGETDAKALGEKEIQFSLPGAVVVVCDFNGAVLGVYQKVRK